VRDVRARRGVGEPRPSGHSLTSSNPLVELITDALAVFRATRLVTSDDITAGLRDRWIEAAYVGAGRHGLAKRDLPHPHEGKWADYALRDPDVPKLATLVVCRWCSGVYVSIGAVLLRRFAPKVWKPLSRLGALSAAAALIAGLEKD
jgi:hypothetical protein